MVLILDAVLWTTRAGFEMHSLPYVVVAFEGNQLNHRTLGQATSRRLCEISGPIRDAAIAMP